jgi:uncharacterized protein (DUF58 family)
VRRAPGVAALGISLCLLAGAFGVRALFVPGVGLAALAIGAEIVVRIAAWRVQITREPRAASVEEGASLLLTVRVRAGPLPFGGGEVRSWPGAPLKPLRWVRRAPIDFAVRPPRRGLHLVGPSIVSFRDPFGICTRSVQSEPCELFVLPRVVSIRREQLARFTGLGHNMPARPGDGTGSDVDGLRPYRQGAPASLIHWPTVARTGILLERRLRDEDEARPLVVLDAGHPSSCEALDKAVRAAASLCVGLARLGGCSLLLPGAERAVRIGPDLDAWPVLHARLALVEPGAALARAPVDRAAIVILVSAHGAAWSVRRPVARADFVVSPFALERRPVLFSVSGCAVQPDRAASGVEDAA